MNQKKQLDSMMSFSFYLVCFCLIFSVPISFSLCFPISPSVLKILFKTLLSVVEKFLYPFSLVAQSCPTLCDPMNCSMPGLPVHHQLPEFTQTHVHRVSDAIQPSHPLSSPSPPVPNPSHHQSLF